MARSLRVLLVAEEAAGVQALGLLHQAGHCVVAVMTDSAGRGSGTSRLGAVAVGMGHPVWPALLVKEPGFAAVVRREEVDLLLNVHALHVIPADVVAAPALGSFNLHPGPLPQYAGLNAPSWAIYHGERTHGVTVHWMDAGIDTGLVAFQVALEVSHDETGLSLSAKCVRAGMPLLRRLLDAAAADPPAIPRVPQADAPRRYYGRQAPGQRWLEWAGPAARVVDFVRACDFLPFTSPWGHPRSTLGEVEVQVLKARRTGNPTAAPPGTVGEMVGTGMLVAAADEWVEVRSVRVAGADAAAAEVLRPGDRLGQPLVAERTV